MAGGITPQFQFRTTVVMPIKRITNAIVNACAVTAAGLADEYRGYLLLRFSDPKHGKLWNTAAFTKTGAPKRGGAARSAANTRGNEYGGSSWYRASAPGEYPAIKYGILYRSMQIPKALLTDTSAKVWVGAQPFPGNTYGTKNDPTYAEDLELLRPYFVRAMNETKGERPDSAHAWFLSTLFETAMARRRAAPRGMVNVAPGTDPGELLALLGGNSFKKIAAEIASGKATIGGEPPVTVGYVRGPILQRSSWT